MNAVDTNVLIYYLDQNEAAKQAKAITLLNGLATPPYADAVALASVGGSGPPIAVVASLLEPRIPRAAQLACSL